MTTEEYLQKDVKPIFDRLDERGKAVMVAFICAYFIKQCEIVCKVLYGGPKDDK